jgi:hypothetical protein
MNPELFNAIARCKYECYVKGEECDLTFKFNVSDYNGLIIITIQFDDEVTRHDSLITRCCESFDIVSLTIVINGEQLDNVYEYLQNVLVSFKRCSVCNQFTRVFTDKCICNNCIFHITSNEPIGDECAICREKMGLNYITLDCKHSFHIKCLLCWKKSDCPLCRKPHEKLELYR